MLHPAMQHKVWQMLEELEMIGEDVLITDGFRTLEEQRLIYAQGRTRPGPIVSNSPAGWSYHNYGLAVDIVPVGPLGVEMSKKNLLEWAALGRYDVLGRIGQGAGLEWGFQLWGVDRPHFQFPGLTIQKIRANAAVIDVEKARMERIAGLQERLEMAKRAVDKDYIKPARRRGLERFIENMTDRLEQIR